MKKIITLGSIILVLMSCNAKKTELSDQEILLEKELSSKYNCKVKLSIDERSVGQKQNNGTYSVVLDFNDSKLDPCILDSISIIDKFKESYAKVKPIVSYKQYHSKVMVSFSKTKVVNNIETTLCNGWCLFSMESNKILKYFNSNNK